MTQVFLDVCLLGIGVVAVPGIISELKTWF